MASIAESVGIAILLDKHYSLIRSIRKYKKAHRKLCKEKYLSGAFGNTCSTIPVSFSLNLFDYMKYIHSCQAKNEMIQFSFDGITTSHVPQHFLYFLPLPHGQGSLRPTFSGVVTREVSRVRFSFCSRFQFSASFCIRSFA